MIFVIMNGNFKIQKVEWSVYIVEKKTVFFPIETRLSMCVDIAVNIHLPTPVHSFYGRFLTLYMLYFFFRGHRKIMSPQKCFLTPPPFVTIFPYFLLPSSSYVTTQKVTNHSSKRETVKYILVLVWCFRNRWRKRWISKIIEFQCIKTKQYILAMYISFVFSS